MNKVLRCFFFHPAKRREEKMYNKCVTTSLVSYVQCYSIFRSTAGIRNRESSRCVARAFRRHQEKPEQSERNTSGELNKNRIREMSQGGQHTMELAGSNSRRTTQFSD